MMMPPSLADEHDTALVRLIAKIIGRHRESSPSDAATGAAIEKSQTKKEQSQYDCASKKGQPSSNRQQDGKNDCEVNAEEGEEDELLDYVRNIERYFFASVLSVRIHPHELPLIPEIMEDNCSSLANTNSNQYPHCSGMGSSGAFTSHSSSLLSSTAAAPPASSVVGTSVPASSIVTPSASTTTITPDDGAVTPAREEKPKASRSSTPSAAAVAAGTPDRKDGAASPLSPVSLSENMSTSSSASNLKHNRPSNINSNSGAGSTPTATEKLYYQFTHRRLPPPPPSSSSSLQLSPNTSRSGGGGDGGINTILSNNGMEKQSSQHQQRFRSEEQTDRGTSSGTSLAIPAASTAATIATTDTPRSSPAKQPRTTTPEDGATEKEREASCSTGIEEEEDEVRVHGAHSGESDGTTTTTDRVGSGGVGDGGGDTQCAAAMAAAMVQTGVFALSQEQISQHVNSWPSINIQCVQLQHALQTVHQRLSQGRGTTTHESSVKKGESSGEQDFNEAASARLRFAPLNAVHPSDRVMGLSATTLVPEQKVLKRLLDHVTHFTFALTETQSSMGSAILPAPPGDRDACPSGTASRSEVADNHGDGKGDSHHHSSESIMTSASTAGGAEDHVPRRANHDEANGSGSEKGEGVVTAGRKLATEVPLPSLLRMCLYERQVPAWVGDNALLLSSPSDGKLKTQVGMSSLREALFKHSSLSSLLAHPRPSAGLYMKSDDETCGTGDVVVRNIVDLLTHVLVGKEIEHHHSAMSSPTQDPLPMEKLDDGEAGKKKNGHMDAEQDPRQETHRRSDAAVTPDGANLHEIRRVLQLLLSPNTATSSLSAPTLVNTIAGASSLDRRFRGDSDASSSSGGIETCCGTATSTVSLPLVVGVLRRFTSTTNVTETQNSNSGGGNSGDGKNIKIGKPQRRGLTVRILSPADLEVSEVAAEAVRCGMSCCTMPTSTTVSAAVDGGANEQAADSGSGCVHSTGCVLPMMEYNALILEVSGEEEDDDEEGDDDGDKDEGDGASHRAGGQTEMERAAAAASSAGAGMISWHEIIALSHFIHVAGTREQIESTAKHVADAVRRRRQVKQQQQQTIGGGAVVSDSLSLAQATAPVSLLAFFFTVTNEEGCIEEEKKSRSATAVSLSSSPNGDTSAPDSTQQQQLSVRSPSPLRRVVVLGGTLMSMAAAVSPYADRIRAAEQAAEKGVNEVDVAEWVFQSIIPIFMETTYETGSGGDRHQTKKRHKRTVLICRVQHVPPRLFAQHNPLFLEGDAEDTKLVAALTDSGARAGKNNNKKNESRSVDVLMDGRTINATIVRYVLTRQLFFRNAIQLPRVLASDGREDISSSVIGVSGFPDLQGYEGASSPSSPRQQSSSSGTANHEEDTSGNRDKEEKRRTGTSTASNERTSSKKRPAATVATVSSPPGLSRRVSFKEMQSNNDSETDDHGNETDTSSSAMRATSSAGPICANTSAVLSPSTPAGRKSEDAGGTNPAAVISSAPSPKSILKSGRRYQITKLLRSSAPASSVVPFRNIMLWRCLAADVVHGEVVDLLVSGERDTAAAKDATERTKVKDSARHHRSSKKGNGAGTTASSTSCMTSARSKKRGSLSRKRRRDVPLIHTFTSLSVTSTTYAENITHLAMRLASEVACVLILAVVAAEREQARRVVSIGTATAAANCGDSEVATGNNNTTTAAAAAAVFTSTEAEQGDACAQQPQPHIEVNNYSPPLLPPPFIVAADDVHDTTAPPSHCRTHHRSRRGTHSSGTVTSTNVGSSSAFSFGRRELIACAMDAARRVADECFAPFLMLLQGPLATAGSNIDAAPSVSETQNSETKEGLGTCDSRRSSLGNSQGEIPKKTATPLPYSSLTLALPRVLPLTLHPAATAIAPYILQRVRHAHAVCRMEVETGVLVRVCPPVDAALRMLAYGMAKQFLRALCRPVQILLESAECRDAIFGCDDVKDEDKGTIEGNRESQVERSSTGTAAVVGAAATAPEGEAAENPSATVTFDAPARRTQQERVLLCLAIHQELIRLCGILVSYYSKCILLPHIPLETLQEAVVASSAGGAAAAERGQVTTTLISIAPASEVLRLENYYPSTSAAAAKSPQQAATPAEHCPHHKNLGNKEMESDAGGGVKEREQQRLGEKEHLSPSLASEGMAMFHPLGQTIAQHSGGSGGGTFHATATAQPPTPGEACRTLDQALSCWFLPTMDDTFDLQSAVISFRSFPEAGVSGHSRLLQQQQQQQTPLPLQQVLSSRLNSPSAGVDMLAHGALCMPVYMQQWHHPSSAGRGLFKSIAMSPLEGGSPSSLVSLKMSPGLPSLDPKATQVLSAFHGREPSQQQQQQQHSNSLGTEAGYSNKKQNEEGNGSHHNTTITTATSASTPAVPVYHVPHAAESSLISRWSAEAKHSLLSFFFAQWILPHVQAIFRRTSEGTGGIVVDVASMLCATAAAPTQSPQQPQEEEATGRDGRKAEPKSSSSGGSSSGADADSDSHRPVYREAEDKPHGFVKKNNNNNKHSSFPAAVRRVQPRYPDSVITPATTVASEVPRPSPAAFAAQRQVLALCLDLTQGIHRLSLESEECATRQQLVLAACVPEPTRKNSTLTPFKRPAPADGATVAQSLSTAMARPPNEEETEQARRKPSSSFSDRRVEARQGGGEVAMGEHQEKNASGAEATPVDMQRSMTLLSPEEVVTANMASAAAILDCATECLENTRLSADALIRAALVAFSNSAAAAAGAGSATLTGRWWDDGCFVSPTTVATPTLQVSDGTYEAETHLSGCISTNGAPGIANGDEQEQQMMMSLGFRGSACPSPTSSQDEGSYSREEDDEEGGQDGESASARRRRREQRSRRRHRNRHGGRDNASIAHSASYAPLSPVLVNQNSAFTLASMNVAPPHHSAFGGSYARSSVPRGVSGQGGSLSFPTTSLGSHMWLRAACLCATSPKNVVSAPPSLAHLTSPCAKPPSPFHNGGALWSAKQQSPFHLQKRGSVSSNMTVAADSAPVGTSPRHVPPEGCDDDDNSSPLSLPPDANENHGKSIQNVIFKVHASTQTDPHPRTSSSFSLLSIAFAGDGTTHRPPLQRLVATEEEEEKKKTVARPSSITLPLTQRLHGAGPLSLRSVISEDDEGHEVEEASAGTNASPSPLLSCTSPGIGKNHGSDDDSVSMIEALMPNTQMASPHVLHFATEEEEEIVVAAREAIEPPLSLDIEQGRRARVRGGSERKRSNNSSSSGTNTRSTSGRATPISVCSSHPSQELCEKVAAGAQQEVIPEIKDDDEEGEGEGVTVNVRASEHHPYNIHVESPHATMGARDPLRSDDYSMDEEEDGLVVHLERSEKGYQVSAQHHHCPHHYVPSTSSPQSPDKKKVRHVDVTASPSRDGGEKYLHISRDGLISSPAPSMYPAVSRDIERELAAAAVTATADTDDEMQQCRSREMDAGLVAHTPTSTHKKEAAASPSSSTCTHNHHHVGHMYYSEELASTPNAKIRHQSSRNGGDAASSSLSTIPSPTSSSLLPRTPHRHEAAVRALADLQSRLSHASGALQQSEKREASLQRRLLEQHEELERLRAQVGQLLAEAEAIAREAEDSQAASHKEAAAEATAPPSKRNSPVQDVQASRWRSPDAMKDAQCQTEPAAVLIDAAGGDAEKHKWGKVSETEGSIEPRRPHDDDEEHVKQKGSMSGHNRASPSLTPRRRSSLAALPSPSTPRQDAAFHLEARVGELETDLKSAEFRMREWHNIVDAERRKHAVQVGQLEEQLRAASLNAVRAASRSPPQDELNVVALENDMLSARVNALEEQLAKTREKHAAALEAARHAHSVVCGEKERLEVEKAALQARLERQQDEAKRSADDAAAIFVMTKAELEGELRELKTRVRNLVQEAQHEELKSQRAEALAKAQREEAGTQAAHTLRKKLEEREAVKSAQQEALLSAHQEELAKMEAKHAAASLQAQAALEQERGVAKRREEALKMALERELQSMRERHGQAEDALRTRHVTQAQELSEMQLRREVEHQEELARASLRAGMGRQTALQAEHEATQAERAHLLQEHTREVKALTRKAAVELQREREEAQAAADSLACEHGAEKAELERASAAALANTVATLKTHMEERTRQLEEDAARAVTKTVVEKDKELEQLKERHEEQRAVMEDALAATQTALETEKSTVLTQRSTVAALQQLLKGREEDAKIAAQEQVQQAVRDARRAHDAEMIAVKQEVRQAEEATDEARRQLKEAQVMRDVAIRTAGMEQAQQIAAFESATAQLQRDHANQLVEQQQRLAAAGHVALVRAEEMRRDSVLYRRMESEVVWQWMEAKLDLVRSMWTEALLSAAGQAKQKAEETAASNAIHHRIVAQTTTPSLNATPADAAMTLDTSPPSATQHYHHHHLHEDPLALRYELSQKDRQVAALQEALRQQEAARQQDQQTVRTLQHLLDVQRGFTRDGGIAGEDDSNDPAVMAALRTPGLVPSIPWDARAILSLATTPIMHTATAASALASSRVPPTHTSRQSALRAASQALDPALHTRNGSLAHSRARGHSAGAESVARPLYSSSQYHQHHASPSPLSSRAIDTATVAASSAAGNVWGRKSGRSASTAAAGGGGYSPPPRQQQQPQSVEVYKQNYASFQQALNK